MGWREMYVASGGPRARAKVGSPWAGREVRSGFLAISRAAKELERALRTIAAPTDIARRCAAIRGALVRELGLELAPTRPPSLERGRELFGQACADCHGATGRADGRRSRELKPPPASFHSAER